MRKWLTSLVEVAGIGLTAIGVAESFGLGAGLIVAGVSLVVIGVTQA